MVEKLEAGTFWVRRFEVASHSNPDKSYVVALNTKDEWGCSCPVWKFRRLQCKHINEVLQVTRFQEVVDQIDEREVTRLVEVNRAELVEANEIRFSSTVVETAVPSRFAYVEV